MRSAISINSYTSKVELSNRLASRSRSNLRTYSAVGASLSIYLATHLVSASQHLTGGTDGTAYKRVRMNVIDRYLLLGSGSGECPVFIFKDLENVGELGHRQQISHTIPDVDQLYVSTQAAHCGINRKQ